MNIGLKIYERFKLSRQSVPNSKLFQCELFSPFIMFVSCHYPLFETNSAMGFVGSIFRQFVAIPQIPSPTSPNGQTVLITGANSSIGLEAARQCVRLDVDTIILPFSTLLEGQSAKDEILRSQPATKTKIEIWNLDLESLDSVISFGKSIQSLPRLDVAMLNAGVVDFDRTVFTLSEVEPALQVNHLSTALLSLLLLPLLRKTSKDLLQPSRLTLTSSEIQATTPAEERKTKSTDGDPEGLQSYKNLLECHGLSKLLSMFWARELASRTSAYEVIIDFFSPGTVNAGLQRDANRLPETYNSVLGKTSEGVAGLSLDGAVVEGLDTPGRCLNEAKFTKQVTFLTSIANSD